MKLTKHVDFNSLLSKTASVETITYALKADEQIPTDNNIKALSKEAEAEGDNSDITKTLGAGAVGAGALAYNASTRADKASVKLQKHKDGRLIRRTGLAVARGAKAVAKGTRATVDFATFRDRKGARLAEKALNKHRASAKMGRLGVGLAVGALGIKTLDNLRKKNKAEQEKTASEKKKDKSSDNKTLEAGTAGALAGTLSTEATRKKAKDTATKIRNAGSVKSTLKGALKGAAAGGATGAWHGAAAAGAAGAGAGAALGTSIGVPLGIIAEAGSKFAKDSKKIVAAKAKAKLKRMGKFGLAAAGATALGSKAKDHLDKEKTASTEDIRGQLANEVERESTPQGAALHRGQQGAAIGGLAGFMHGASKKSSIKGAKARLLRGAWHGTAGSVWGGAAAGGATYAKKKVAPDSNADKEKAFVEKLEKRAFDNIGRIGDLEFVNAMYIDKEAVLHSHMDFTTPKAKKSVGSTGTTFNPGTKSAVTIGRSIKRKPTSIAQAMAGKGRADASTIKEKAFINGNNKGKGTLGTVRKMTSGLTSATGTIGKILRKRLW